MKPQPAPENPFVNLLVNILIPVMVLNKGSEHLGPRLSLGVALAFPLAYGVQDYVRRRHKNYVSIIGIANILLTGGLALLELQGIWFAAKEAALPFVLGIAVLGSAWTDSPAARMLFCNPHVIDMPAVEERLAATGRTSEFERLIRATTGWLSLSFFISALANFLLARHIFRDIDQQLGESARTQLLNEQIAQMTWMGFAVIALPLMVFSGILVYRFLHRLARLTEIPLNNLMKG